MKSRVVLAAAIVGVVASMGAGPSTRPTTSTRPAPAVTLAEARARFESAEGKARGQYRADLGGLLKRAMRDGDLRSANAASDAIKQLDRAEGKGHVVPAAVPVRVSVQATGDWQKVMNVRQGDVLRVTAGGEWCVDTSAREIRTCGPDGLTGAGTPVPGVQQWSILMGRVGLKHYVIGRASRIEVEQDGVLEMRINDWNTDDNDGSVAVAVAREGTEK